MSSAAVNPLRLPVARQISLVEAMAWVVLLNVAIYALAALLGLGGLWQAEAATPEQPELKFTFADVSEEAEAGEEAAPTGVDEQGATPGTPEIAPPLEQQEAPATLDQPQPAIPPSLPSPASLPLPGNPATDNPPAPVEETVESDSTEPPSDGIAEGATEGDADPLDQPFDESVEEQAEAEGEAPAEEVDFDEQPEEPVEEFEEADDGGFATLRQPPPAAPPPALGRPAGPSVDERISEFGRALQRYREMNPPSPSQQPRNVFEPDWSSLPTTGQTIGNMMFESADFDWEDYGRQIYWVIWRAWHNRLLARVDDFEKWAQQTSTPILDHFNGVQFTIERNGQITGILLEHGSGSEPFDLSAIEALDESVLPPLPAAFPRDSETVHVQFIGYGPIGQMRRGLTEFKRRGWF